MLYKYKNNIIKKLNKINYNILKKKKKTQPYITLIYDDVYRPIQGIKVFIKKFSFLNHTISA
jgi:hypothetical protein